jgi:hypothetical protein
MKKIYVVCDCETGNPIRSYEEDGDVLANQTPEHLKKYLDHHEVIIEFVSTGTVIV